MQYSYNTDKQFQQTTLYLDHESGLIYRNPAIPVYCCSTTRLNTDNINTIQKYY